MAAKAFARSRKIVERFVDRFGDCFGRYGLLQEWHPLNGIPRGHDLFAASACQQDEG